MSGHDTVAALTKNVLYNRQMSDHKMFRSTEDFDYIRIIVFRNYRRFSIRASHRIAIAIIVGLSPSPPIFGCLQITMDCNATRFRGITHQTMAAMSGGPETQTDRVVMKPQIVRDSLHGIVLEGDCTENRVQLM